MIRLTIAVGFLAVFGFTTWVIVLLLKNYFQNKTKNQTKPDEQL